MQLLKCCKDKISWHFPDFPVFLIANNHELRRQQYIMLKLYHKKLNRFSKNSWEQRTLKLASDPLRCCKARDAIKSCSSLMLTLTLPHERDIEEDGRFSCGGVEAGGIGAGGGGGGWSRWWCWWCWWMWWSSHEAVGTGPLQSITTSPTAEPPITEELVVLSLELCRLGGDGGHRFGRCGLLSSPYVNWYLLSKSLGNDLYWPGVAVIWNYIYVLQSKLILCPKQIMSNWSDFLQFNRLCRLHREISLK